MRELYEPRDYRASFAAEDLVSFRVMDAETDLQVLAQRDLGPETLAIVRRIRSGLERYLSTHPRFGESYAPLQVEEDAPEMVRDMAEAATQAGVGPMAAVAGAIAQRTAEELSEASPEVIVENGGDVYLCGSRPRTVGLWTGEDGAKGVGLEIRDDQLPLAVATSSGTFGHSTSFGSADTVTVLARSGALADAVATAIGNVVHGPDDAEKAIEKARSVPGVLGVVVSVSGTVAAWGDVRLVPVGIE